MKPTYGRVSRYGLVAFASSLDQIGPLARTAEDAALLLEVIAGHDPRDSTSLDVPVPPYTADRQPAARGPAARLGPRAFRPKGSTREVEAAVRAAVDVYESLGATVHEISLPHGKYARGHVLHHRPLRGLEQSGPLRRRPLRLSHRTKRKCSPSWRPSGSSCKPPATKRGARQSRHGRWCACIAAPGPKALGPR